MPIVAYYIDGMNAKRSTQPTGRVDIKSGSKILSIGETKTGMKNKFEALAIDFEFKTIYEPGVGEITFNGRLVYVGDDVKEGLKLWEKKKDVPEKIGIEVKNFLFRKCLGLGITISENMNLPPPVFFPIVTQKPKGNEINMDDLRYIG